MNARPARGTEEYSIQELMLADRNPTNPELPREEPEG
jgi:hypothetical protein